MIRKSRLRSAMGWSLAMGLGLWVLSMLWSWAAESDAHSVRVTQEPQRRGAVAFMSLCSGCHALDVLRLRRLAEDLRLNNSDLGDFLDERRIDLDQTWLGAMAVEDAQRWFGQAPPDLSLVAQQRGSAWIQRYLGAFYLDTTRPSGWNNRLVHDTAMPNVLWDYSKQTTGAGYPHKATQVSDQDRIIADISAFLVYVADPSAQRRHKLGPWVIGFFIGFTCILCLLQREYWKDIL